MSVDKFILIAIGAFVFIGVSSFAAIVGETRSYHSCVIEVSKNNPIEKVKEVCKK